MGMYTDKVIIATGAAAGIGQASAIAFAREGGKVALADLNEEGLQETAARVEAAGSEAFVVPTDVGDADAAQRMVDKTVARFGKLDVLFNNAGITSRAVIHETEVEEWRRVINTNLSSVFYCTRAALPEMLKNKSGVIINTSSMSGLVGTGTVAAYSAAKHGVNGLTKSTALEYSRQGIRCVSLCPGYIVTPLTEAMMNEEYKAHFISLVPLGRSATADEAAEFVIWLGSDKAAYVNGSCHQIDGGLLSGIGIIDG